MPVTPFSTNTPKSSFVLKTIGAAVWESQDSEQTYRFLFESIPQPLIVYDESSLRILAVNEAATLTYGYAKNEFLSLTVADLENPFLKLSEISSDGLVR